MYALSNESHFVCDDSASSANSFGQSTLAQKLFQTEKELEKLRIERDESTNNTNWRVERGELLSNWNVS